MVEKAITNAMPKIFGLVLCGGASTRMGKDKSLLNYHGVPQKEYLFHLLSQTVDRCFYSQKQPAASENVIADTFDISSPLNGILSAFETYPEVAWLVIACDMPLIEEKHIKHLISERSEQQLATCFSATDNKPHPLFTIYELSARDALKSHSQTSISPRNFLMNHHVKIIEGKDKSFLTSIDTLEEFKRLKNQL